jgi:hypothetical protein
MARAKPAYGAINNKSSSPVRTLPKGDYYDLYTGKKVTNYNNYTGTLYSPNGGVYNVVGGQIRTTATPVKGTNINVNNKEQPLYEIDGKFYYFDGTKVKQLTDERQIEYARNNEEITLIARDDDKSGVPTADKKTETAKKEEEAPKKQTSSGGGTPGYDAAYNKLATQNKELMDRIYELEHPKVLTADEAAKLYGIDYNLDNILKEYNEKTNAYYDKAVAEQQGLRTNYARNNANYYDQVADAYVNSYKNTAPTATGRSALAANALSTMLSSGQTNSDNDYGMLQNIHSYEQKRAAELANNPLLAEDVYNSIGTYLSQLSAQENAAAVKQYVAKLDAYSDIYASDRALQDYQAQANAAKYSGLAGATIAKAGSASSGTNSWDQLWNYYYNTTGNSKYASQMINSYIKDYQSTGNY